MDSSCCTLSDFLMASSLFNLKKKIQIIVLATCFQKTGGFARNWPLAYMQNLLQCSYVIHSTSAFSKPNIQGLSAEKSEACIEYVD
jgi:hypothetical protein